MELKHTPSPWFFTKNESDYFEIRQNDSENLNSEYNPAIGNIHMNPYTSPPTLIKNAEANARLIAAAPEMLECLIIEVKIYAMSEGIESAKKTKACELIEKATGLKIEEVLK